jgi:hypothetical protein
LYLSLDGSAFGSIHTRKTKGRKGSPFPAAVLSAKPFGSRLSGLMEKVAGHLAANFSLHLSE